MDIVSVIVTLIFIVIGVIAARIVIDWLGLPPPVPQLLYLLLAVLCLCALLYAFGLMPAGIIRGGGGVRVGGP